MKILEVGSGNLDTHTHLNSKDVCHIDIIKESHHIENVCDTHKLPFKDNCFEVVYCAHVLEHCYNPYKVLSELKRVSKKHVVIAVPNCNFYRNIGECEEHIYSWNPNTLGNLLIRIFRGVDVQTKFKVREGKSKIKKVFTYYFFGSLKLLFRSDNDLIAVCLK